MRYPMKLMPALKDYIWGGTKLNQEYGKETTLPTIAESWELSCHRDGQSVIANGSAAGQTLAAWLKGAPEALGRRAARFPYFPLLIKLIDAKDNLSVQVHPDDDYAMRVEGEYGKTEMWYIVDAEEGACLLYGFRTPITQEEFARRIADGTLLDVVNRVPVKKGDVFFIPAGTLHAIGKGIVTYEIQQSSNITYRIYDYGRVGTDGLPRALHIDKAVDVTHLTPPQEHFMMARPMDVFAGMQVRQLASCSYFTVYEIVVEDMAQLRVGEESFQSFTVVDGAVTLSAGGEVLPLRKGESVFLPAGLGRYELAGSGRIILSEL